jgi:putative acetyltransferase
LLVEIAMFDPIRPVVPEDDAAVDALLRRAFGGATEADLVRKLRPSKEFRAWVVGVPVPIAYAAVSAFDAPGDWLCLAPVAVAPEEQKRGVATALLRHVVAELMAEKRTVVVLGEPRLYARAGFSRERAARLVTPYPLGATLIARPGTDSPSVRLTYNRAFAGV